MNGLRSNRGKEGNQGLAWREKGKRWCYQKLRPFCRGCPMGVDPRGSLYRNTARGKNEWGQIPWAGPFFPPCSLPAGHPSGSAT